MSGDRREVDGSLALVTGWLLESLIKLMKVCFVLVGEHRSIVLGFWIFWVFFFSIYFNFFLLFLK